jgi:hypothetical protein
MYGDMAFKPFLPPPKKALVETGIMVEAVICPPNSPVT